MTPPSPITSPGPEWRCPLCAGAVRIRVERGQDGGIRAAEKITCNSCGVFVITVEERDWLKLHPEDAPALAEEVRRINAKGGTPVLTRRRGILVEELPDSKEGDPR